MTGTLFRGHIDARIVTALVRPVNTRLRALRLHLLLMLVRLLHDVTALG